MNQDMKQCHSKHRIGAEEWEREEQIILEVQLTELNN